MTSNQIIKFYQQIQGNRLVKFLMENLVIPLTKKEYIDYEGGRLYLEEKDGLRLSLRTHFEPETEKLIKRHVGKNSIAFDIGSHIGFFTLLLAKQCKKVYAFEPVPETYQTLEKNIRFNKILNVVPNQMAVSNKNGKSDFFISRSDVLSRLAKFQDFERKITVNTIRLDSHYTKADFIKMDIEGGEYNALLGMENLIKNNNLVLIMEYALIFQKNPSILIKFLEKYFKTIYSIDEDSGLQDFNKAKTSNILCLKE